MESLPPISFAILKFFRNQPDLAPIIGDMSEEFHQRSWNTGQPSAKWWFRRETLRNVLALTWRELKRTPVRTTLGALFAVLFSGIPLPELRHFEIVYLIQALYLLA